MKKEIRQFVTVEEFKKKIKLLHSRGLFHKTAFEVAKGDPVKTRVLHEQGMLFLGMILTVVEKFEKPKKEMVVGGGFAGILSNKENADVFMRNSWNYLAPHWATFESPMNYFLTVISMIERINIRKDTSGEIKVLSLGSGPGLYELFFAQLINQNKVKLHISDYVQEMVNFSQQAAGYLKVNNTEHEVIDMNNINKPGNTFDSVWVNNSLQWSFSQEKAISEISRVLKNGSTAHIIIHEQPMRFSYKKENSQWGEYIIPTIEVPDVLEKHHLQVYSMRSMFSTHGQGGGLAYRRIIDVVKNPESFPTWKEALLSGQAEISNIGSIAS